MRSRNWPFSSGRSANCQPCIAQRQISLFDDYKLKILDEGICNGQCGGVFWSHNSASDVYYFRIQCTFQRRYCFVREHVWFFLQSYSIRFPFKFAFLSIKIQFQLFSINTLYVNVYGWTGISVKWLRKQNMWGRCVYIVYTLYIWLHKFDSGHMKTLMKEYLLWIWLKRMRFSWIN